uniref:Uncharacterized protein n=1 Tax=Mycena chlorophos TaxID=658473 RepID=A0ABQ0M2D1_MYCCL|nr:predicted protein [Mycena chlorophos]
MLALLRLPRFGCRRHALQALSIRAYGAPTALFHSLQVGPRRLVPAGTPGSKIEQRHRRYASVDAKARLEVHGLPLVNSGPTTAALLAYADAHWPSPPPEVTPAGWSTDWKNWDYLLTLFAYSPYYLRLPQIEMLVNVKYEVPGEVRPIMYHPTEETLIFIIEREASDDEGNAKEGDGEQVGGAEIYYLNCRTFDLFAFDPDHAPNIPVPEDIEELVTLIGTAPAPASESIPLVQLEPSPDGEAALKRILERDESVIPLLAADFLGYTPKATTPEQELADPDEIDKTRRAKLAEAIQNAREYIRETEEELEKEAADVQMMRAKGQLPVTPGDEEQAYAHMRAALQEAKGKLKELEAVWEGKYGVSAPARQA